MQLTYYDVNDDVVTMGFATSDEGEHALLRQLVGNVVMTGSMGIQPAEVARQSAHSTPSEATTEEATPKKRKRRTKAEIEADEAAAAAESEETSGKDTASIPAPEKKHRRRTSDDDQKPESDDSVRRPRSKSKDEPKAEAAAEGDSDLTDEDLSKMVSEAAREIGPDAVMEVLETFGVVATSDLKPKFRAQFAAKLAEKVEAESD